MNEIVSFEGNGCRPSHKGVGFSDDGVMYTLNTTEVHGVMYSEPFVYDSHPMDSRVTPCTKNCQTLSTRFGQEYSPNTILVRKPQAERNKESSMIDGNHKPNETRYVVRRITPKECERLQGFPDGYTDIPWPKGQCPDSHRYKALGNSMAVPVMRLIGESIDFALSHPITEDKSDKIAYQTSLFDF